MMALAPALAMAAELPVARQPLPVFKVLYRNTNRIQERGGRQAEVLRPVTPGTVVGQVDGAELLREAIHRREIDNAERRLATLAQVSPEDAFNALLLSVQEQTEVHRVVLPYRAWDLLGVTGPEHAHTLLRQSVRYCIRAESSQPGKASEPSTVLPRLLEEYHLLDRRPGTRVADDQWVDAFSQALFAATPTQAAEAAAAALAEDFEPDAVGEAISLAANQLVLRDHGRTPHQEGEGKPVGSVHGDSIGVHACDSANAWRNMARVSNPRNTFACLILGAYQVALDRTQRGGDFLNWQPVPAKWHLDQIQSTAPAMLIRELDEAIRHNLQARAAAVISCYGALGHPARPLFDLMLEYAVSEDGALHAEKYYRTVVEEFERTRPAFRWRQLLALARVTASEYGRPAPGVGEARALLGVS
jgi:hypothetical protein